MATPPATYHRNPVCEAGLACSSKPDVAGSNPAGGAFAVPLLMRFGRVGGGMAGIESRSHCRRVPSLAVACRGLMATYWRHFSPIPNRGDGIPSRREEPRMTNTGERDQLAAEIDEQLHHGRN